MRNSYMGTALRWIAGAAVITVAAGCGRESTSSLHREAQRIEITDRGQDHRPVVATWVRGSGWEPGSQLPTISHSGESPGRISIGVRAFDEEGAQIPLSETGEYQSTWRAVSESPSGLMRLDDTIEDRYEGDHLNIRANEGMTGTAQIVIAIWHGAYPRGHEEVTTSAIGVTVTD